MKFIQGWHEYELGEIAKIERGKFSARPRNDPQYYGGDTPFIQTGDVAQGKGQVRRYSQTLNEKGLKVSKKFPKGTLVMTIAANIGDVAEVTFDYACPDSIVVFQPIKEIKSKWLFYSLQNLNKDIKALAPENAQANLNLQILNPIRLLVPPIHIQHEIADLLSTWDRAIETTEKLIEAKEKTLTGYLEDLTVNFNQEKTNTMQLGDVFSERNEMNRSDLPLLSITREEGVVNRDDTNRKDSSNEDKSKYLRICIGDIGYNTMRMWQGVSALSTLEGIVSPAYTICIPNTRKIIPQFAAFLFKNRRMIHEFYRRSQGLTSDTWNLKFHHFSKITIELPSLEYQEKVADFLLSLEKEIGGYRRLLQAYKTQKQGLMQKLLTGKWRIKVKI